MINNSYEYITFEVEKELIKPKRGFFKQSIEEIFSDTFKRAKEIEDEESKEDTLSEQNHSFDSEEYQPLEVLNYNFDTDNTEFFNAEKKSLIQGLIEAYKNHYPITVSPDMIWLLFLQGYSRFMDTYHDTTRTAYVNFEGKKTLNISRKNVTPETATKNDWQDIVNEFTQKIKEIVGENTISNLKSNFSTTNSVILTTSQLSIMSAMKNYFTYEVEMDGCGISSITLEGSLDDWNNIKSKLEFLSRKEMCLSWWIKHLIPIIDKIIMTKHYYSQNNIINEEIKNFWKDMIRIKEGIEYDPTYIDGWIIKFIPDFSEKEPKLYDKLKEDDVPDQIIYCPLKLTFINPNESTTIYECSLASGFFGMIQDEITYNVKPVIGYAILVENKKTILQKNIEEIKILNLFI